MNYLIIRIMIYACNKNNYNANETAWEIEDLNKKSL